MTKEFDVSEFESLSKKIIEDWNNIWERYYIIIIIFTPFIFVWFWFSLTFNYIEYYFIIILIWMIMAPILLIVGERLGQKIWSIIVKPFFSLVQYIKDVNILLFRDISEIQTIIEILDKINKIYFIMRILLKIKKFWKFINKLTLNSNYVSLRKNSLMLLIELLDRNINWIIWLLSDLRSDLSIRLTEQRSLLESAKWDVKKHIQWTTELESISELQKIRLDKQIEQFEELQKILIRT